MIGEQLQAGLFSRCQLAVGVLHHILNEIFTIGLRILSLILFARRRATYFNVIGLKTEAGELRRFFTDRFTNVVSRILRDVRIVAEERFTSIFHGLRVDQVGFALGMLGYLKGFLQRRIFAQETRVTMRDESVQRFCCLITRRLPGKCFGTCRLDCRGGEDIA